MVNMGIIYIPELNLVQLDAEQHALYILLLDPYPLEDMDHLLVECPKKNKLPQSVSLYKKTTFFQSAQVDRMDRMIVFILSRFRLIAARRGSRMSFWTKSWIFA